MRLLFIILLFSIRLNATNYYVDAVGGADGNAGTSTGAAWQTISKVNSFQASFVSGDSILFKRGQSFTGTLRLNKDGTSGSRIVYGAYSTGANPIFDGFTTLTSWTSLGSNKYEKTISGQSEWLNMVLVDGVFCPVGRYPNFDPANNGWVDKIDSHTGLTSFVSSTISGYPSFVNGEVVVRKLHWIVDRLRVLSQTSNTVGVRPILTPSGQDPYGINDEWGFFFQNHVNTLDLHKEWSFDSTSNKITMYLSSDPTNYTIRVSNTDTLVDATLMDYIDFVNIDFQGANTIGVFMNSSSNIRWYNCNFNFMGVTAIKAAASDCSTFTIDGCGFTYINGTAIDGNSSNAWTIQNCTVNHIADVRGMSYSGDSQANFASYLGDGTTFKLNNLKNIGYIGLHYVESNILILNNVVDSFCIGRDDGAAFYTYGGSTYSNRKVFWNIVSNGIGDPYGVDPAVAGSSAYGLYTDDATNHITLAYNTVYNVTGAGYHFNGSDSVKIYGNTFYNNYVGFNLNGSQGGASANIVMKKNIFFQTDSAQYVGKVYQTGNAYTNWPGSIDSNWYCRPEWEPASVNSNGYNAGWPPIVHDGGIIEYYDGGLYKYVALANWQSYATNWDDNSQKSPNFVTTSNDTLYVNKTNGSVNTSTGGRMLKDIEGNIYDGSVTLQPFQGLLLFDVGAASGSPDPRGRKMRLKTRY